MLKIVSKKRFASIKQFQIIEDRKIGCGSFGTVKLARHASTCRMYALKIIDLKHIPQSELKLVEREIKLHSELDHPHIIKLWETMADDDHIYMVMEYAEQGNLFSYQSTKTVFSEAEAFKFFTQTVRGVQYLHGQDMLHRDLKPENLLLDACHNVKICDFGWCAEGLTAKRTTFCGTYEYMAPEMLFKSHYDYRVDIWALGVLLYEMLHGTAPFKGKTASQVQQAMLKGGYDQAAHLSEEVKKLMKSLLQFQADKRPSLQQILQHKWMKDMEEYLNNYLTAENAVLPRDIHPKIIQIPNHSAQDRPKPEGLKHRKNNSLNFDSSRSININLEINNFSIMSKLRPNNYHSQEKDSRLEGYTTAKESHLHRTSLKKSRLQPCSPQVSHPDLQCIIQKMKTAKPVKLSCKDAHFDEQKRKDKDGHAQNISKKKFKMRKSQVDFSEKYPIRFNTQFNEKDQWHQPPRLRKGNIKQKLLVNSKSMLRISKSGIFQ